MRILASGKHLIAYPGEVGDTKGVTTLGITI
jgi:hypothetical protein